MDGAEMIRRERATLRGLSRFRSVRFPNGELAAAARCLLENNAHPHPTSPPTEWPWRKGYWAPKSRLKNLARAGALIAAEFDRIQLMGEK